MHKILNVLVECLHFFIECIVINLLDKEISDLLLRAIEDLVLNVGLETKTAVHVGDISSFLSDKSVNLILVQEC